MQNCLRIFRTVDAVLGTLAFPDRTRCALDSVHHPCRLYCRQENCLHRIGFRAVSSQVDNTAFRTARRCRRTQNPRNAAQHPVMVVAARKTKLCKISINLRTDWRKLRKSIGIPSTGAISPCGMDSSSAGVNRSASRRISCASTSPPPCPAKLKYVWFGQIAQRVRIGLVLQINQATVCQAQTTSVFKFPANFFSIRTGQTQMQPICLRFRIHRCLSNPFFPPCRWLRPSLQYRA